MIRRLMLIAAASFAWCLPAPAQIRIVAYNTATWDNTNGNPNAGLQNVLAGIGTASLGGVAKRIDILSLNEQNNATGTTTQQILNMMNSLYGPGTYAKSSLIADNSIEPDQDSPAVIYDQTKFTLIGETLVGIAGGSPNPPRQEIRYQFRPVGYGANADFYVYGVHYKANGDADSQLRRNTEAGVMRANANTLPAGSRILYTGDFNLTEATSEAAWATITGAGTNSGTAGIDPAGGSWANANKTWSTTSLGSRLDFQFQTAPTNDGHGFSLINGTYGPFSNTGVASGGQSPNANVRTASDHYPVVADYRYPARLNVAVGSAPTQVITGASVQLNVAVTNTAPTQAATGADGLDYSVTASGSLTGGGSGTALLALSPANNHNVALNTSTPGLRSGTISVTSSSQEVANGTFSQAVSVQVLDHAQPSLSSIAGTSVATIDFGIHGRGLGNATGSLSIYNLLGSSATAGLDLDSINGTGDTSALTTNAAPFVNLPAGANSHNDFVATIDAVSNGTFNASYTFNLSDENLLGASTRGPLTLVLTGIIATPGDSDLNGSINFDDYAHIDNGFNNGLSGWFNGDFDGNGTINFDDYALIDLNFNNQFSGGSLNAVPEPGTVLSIVGVALLLMRRSRIR